MTLSADASSFQLLIRRLQAGDASAANEIVEHFGEQIHRVARIRMAGSNLRRVVDSQDICQSVMANFFARAATGQFELDSPQDLLRLLATMVRNRINNAAAFHQAARRDLRRNAATEKPLQLTPHRGVTPSLEVSRQELMSKIKSLLSEDELRLISLRMDGQSWGEIAHKLGGKPDQMRKRYARTIARLGPQLDETSR